MVPTGDGRDIFLVTHIWVIQKMSTMVVGMAFVDNR